MTREKRLQAIRQAAHAARRRRELNQWQETHDRLVRTPARTPDEAVAKAEALSLIMAARP